MKTLELKRLEKFEGGCYSMGIAAALILGTTVTPIGAALIFGAGALFCEREAL